MCPDVADFAVATRHLHLDQLHAGPEGGLETEGLEDRRLIAGVFEDDAAKGEDLTEIHGEAGPRS